MNIQQPPPVPVSRMTPEDESHLNLLAVFHYVLGGLCLLGIGFLVLHFMMMSFFFQMASDESARVIATPSASLVAVETTEEITGDVEAEFSGSGELSPSPAAPAPMGAYGASHGPAFPKEMMSVFIVFYIVMGLFVAAIATANFMSGWFIKKRKNKTFSLVVSGFNCLQIPFGTVLGVFTIIVLMRPSVQSGYDANLAP